MESTFSVELERWLGSDSPKTFGEMSDVFGEKGFAVTVLLLMSIPALPLPTGGITHVFEAITILLGIEMVLGRKTMWLPKRLRNRELGPIVAERAMPFIIKRVRWFEKRSRRRLPNLFRGREFTRVLGLVIIVFALAAGLAPPFSGLDTVPALGAVLVALAIILEDAVVLAVGVVVGTAGIVLMASIGTAVVKLVSGLF
ncbi:MAG TPA: exopolysaccharide biosynthesis protein [Acidimicrobiales bacterium]|nr:exopolysaccharide biosynthesis protein [Acidimicrobiales bacterium]